MLLCHFSPVLYYRLASLFCGTAMSGDFEVIGVVATITHREKLHSLLLPGRGCHFMHQVFQLPPSPTEVKTTYKVPWESRFEHDTVQISESCQKVLFRSLWHCHIEPLRKTSVSFVAGKRMPFHASGSPASTFTYRSKNFGVPWESTWWLVILTRKRCNFQLLHTSENCSSETRAATF